MIGLKPIIGCSRKRDSHPMEGKMHRSFVTTATAITIFSLASVVSAQAGGGATSAPSKYNNASHSASVDQNRRHWRLQTVNYRITEFSSSSARSSAPKR
jgi:hypothetical protein